MKKIKKSYIAILLFFALLFGIVAGNFNLSLAIWQILCMLILSIIATYYCCNANKEDMYASFTIIVFFLLGFLLIQPYKSYNSLINLYNRQRINLEATVLSPPLKKARFNRYDLQVKKLNGTRVSGLLQLNCYSLDKLDLYSDYRFKGVVFESKIKPLLIVHKVDKPKLIKEGNFFKLFLRKLSDSSSTVFYKHLSASKASFLETILLGRNSLEWGIKEVFRDAGTVHLLAISGMHVAIIAALFLIILGFFRLERKTKLILASIFVMVFSFLCFNKPPVLRAAIMFTIFCGFAYLQRPFLNFHSLALAGIVSLLIDPSVLFGLSFQLSFVAVAFIMLGFKYFWPRRKFKFWLNAMLVCFGVSFFAILGTLPLISYYFAKIYLLSWLSGTLTAPFLPLIIYGSVLLLFLSPISSLANLTATTLSLLIDLFININKSFAQLPWMSVNFRFNVGLMILYYLIVLMFIFFVKHMKKSS